eukprot:240269_1
MQSKLRLFAWGLRQRQLALVACGCSIGLTGFAGFKASNARSMSVSRNSDNAMYWKKESEKEILIESIPDRKEQILTLQKRANDYDVIVVGGGATGSGIALDAVTRGLSVALIDSNDFASGTSSRSTKLIHGGVRYLEQAITNFDLEAWNLVCEAISERRHLINLTPYLSCVLPIIIPVYDDNVVRGWYHLIRHYIGCKIYELMAGRDGSLAPTYYLSSAQSRSAFPHLKPQNMAGSIVYFDGLHNDSRTCLALALTASAHGATVANYVEMVEFIKAKQSKEIIGVRMRDNLTGHEWNTFGKVVINATGCGVDRVRRKDNCQLNENENLIVPSRGTHLMLPSTFSSENYGMLIPQTKDGRVAFLLPFEGVTIAGTTDVAMQAQELPDTKQLVQPSQSEVAQILTEINNYLDVHVKATDVDAAWSGVRPLGCVPDGYRQTVINETVNVIKRVETEATLQKQQKVDASTKSLSRHHLIEVSATGLITICGGKWTTYRQMAQDCVDIACDLHPEIGARASECVTKVVKIVGAAKWSHGVPAVLERHNIPPHIAKHLSNAYGDKAFMVGDLYLSKWDQPLAGGYSYTEAEVIYCSKYEMSQ